MDQICAVQQGPDLRRSADMPLRGEEKNYKNLRRSPRVQKSAQKFDFFSVKFSEIIVYIYHLILFKFNKVLFYHVIK